MPDPRRTKLLDKDGVVRNPATEDTLEDARRLLAFLRGPSGAVHTTTRRTQYEARFFEHDPNDLLDLRVTGSAFAEQNVTGDAHFHTGTTPGSTLDARTWERIQYASTHPFFKGGSITLPRPTGSGKVEFGIFDETAGVFIRRTAAQDYVVRRYHDGVSTVEEAVSWDQRNGDPLDGSADSNFTEGGTPLAHDRDTPALDRLADLRVLDIQGIWYGGAPIGLRWLSPDSSEDKQVWVILHTFRHASNPEVSIPTPALPSRLYMENGDAAEDLEPVSGCWAGGTESPVQIPVKSHANSTDTPLTAATTGLSFNGKAVSMLNFPFLNVFAKSNVAGTVTVKFGRTPALALAGEVTVTFEYDPSEEFSQTVYRRLDYVAVDFDADADQTTFSLQTDFTSDEPDAPTEPLKQNMGRGQSAVRSKAALFALDGNTTRQVTAGGLAEALSGSGRHAIDVRSFLHGYNGATWDFLRTSGFGLAVDVLRSVLPAGAATKAAQDLNTSAVDNVRTALAAILSSIDSAVADVATATKQDSLLAEFSSEFTRIKEKRFRDTEEVRHDIPVSKISAQIYTGKAPAGSATSATVWDVVRTDFDAAGNPSRERIQTGIAWDSRTAGWT